MMRNGSQRVKGVYVSLLLKSFSGAGMIGILIGTASLSWAYTPENTLLKVKGYSHEVVNSAEHQRSRQEWKTEPNESKLTGKERFLRNIYHGDWIETFDQFEPQVNEEH